MTFEDILDQALALLQRRGRVTYGTLQRQFALDASALEDLKDALLFSHPQIVDEDGRGLVWTGDMGVTLALSPALPPSLLADPQHAQTAQGIRPSAGLATPEAERRQLTVLFCDLVDSTVLASHLTRKSCAR